MNLGAIIGLSVFGYLFGGGVTFEVLKRKGIGVTKYSYLPDDCFGTVWGAIFWPLVVSFFLIRKTSMWLVDIVCKEEP
jgi:hypothetical protein